LTVSHSDPAPADSHQERPAAAPDELYRKAFGELAETFTPWFFEFGSWIFGGLIAFTLLVLAPLITLGPVDRAITVATAAFALALPLDVAGLFLLRLVQDLNRVGFEDTVAHAFGEVGSAVGAPVPAPSTLEAQRKRRSGSVLRISLSILALSGLLAVSGMVAVLWHMAWWIAVAFLAMAVLSLVVIAVAMAAAQPRGSDEAKAQRRLYQEQRRRAREAIPRQAHARDRKNDERT
jgi:hypothetical protein